jgi:hypothetical protein
MPVFERMELVQQIHSEIVAILVSGGGKNTAKSIIYCMRRFFAWADDAGSSMTIGTVVDAFICWTDHLLHRQRVVRDLNERGVYQLAKSVAAVLDRLFERRIGILANTRIRKPRHDRRRLDTGASRQSLAQSIAFGHTLVDMCDTRSTASAYCSA